MENVAHALAGALLAEGVIQLRARRGSPPSPREARWLAAGSALANNLPDLDVTYAYAADGPLGYLLHHRGHTHTLLGGVVLGVVFGVVLVLLARWRKVDLEARWLLGLCSLGPLVHVAMDGWNVYGVHPFWPIDDAWYYGDAVFIFEPLLWAAAMPPLLFATSSRGWRITLGALLVMACVLPWLASAFVPLELRISFPIVVALLSLVAWRAGPGLRAVIGLASFAAVAGGFFAVSSMARSEVQERLARDFPEARTADVALSPWPANALCWSAVAIQVDGGDLVLRRATVSAFPSVFPASDCPSPGERSTAELAEVDAPSDEALAYRGEARARIARLARLAEESCEAQAMLQFTRAPFLVDRGVTTVLGDLRFDRDEGLDFAELELDPSAPRCPPLPAPWLPPLQEILSEARAAGEAGSPSL